MSSGLRFDLKQSDVGWHPDESEGFFELWDCYCIFEDGYNCVIGFHSRPWYPLIDYKAEEANKPLCMVNVITPDGTSHVFRKSFSDSSFKASKNTLDVTLGENRLLGKFDANGRYQGLYVKAGDNNIAAELDFNVKIGTLKLTDREDNLTYFNPAAKKYFGWFLIGAKSEIEGKLTLNGKTVKVKGLGLNNYNLGNIKLPDIQSRWFFTQIYAGDYTITCNDSTATKRHNYSHFTPFILWKGDSVMMNTYNCAAYGEEFTIDPISGGPYPVIETFKAASGDIEVTGYLPAGALVDNVKFADVPGFSCTQENPCYHYFQFSDAEVVIKKGQQVEKIKGRAFREFFWADKWFPYKK